MSEQSQARSSVYRCAECGNGKHLVAISHGLMEGQLNADGSLDSYDWVEDTEVCEDSIRCTVHGDAVEIDKLIDGRYHRWQRCEACEGQGQIRASFQSYVCHVCRGRRGREVPVEELAAA